MSVPTPNKPPLQRRYQGVPPEDRQRIRREKLVEAAIEIFGKRGFKHATMRDICALARLSDRYFYESFRNIEEIFDVVYNDMAEQLIQAMALGMSQAPVSPEGIVKAGLHAFFQFIHDDARRAQIMLIDAVHAGQYQAQASQQEAAVGEVKPSSYNRVVTLLSNGMAFEHLPGIQGRLVASGLVGMAIHTAIAWAQEGFQITTDEILEHNFYAWRGLNLWTQERELAQNPAKADKVTTLQSASPQVIRQMLSTFRTTPDQG